jgi:hypothetical protein
LWRTNVYDLAYDQSFPTSSVATDAWLRSGRSYDTAAALRVNYTGFGSYGGTAGNVAGAWAVRPALHIDLSTVSVVVAEYEEEQAAVAASREDLYFYMKVLERVLDGRITDYVVPNAMAAMTLLTQMQAAFDDTEITSGQIENLVNMAKAMLRINTLKFKMLMNDIIAAVDTGQAYSPESWAEYEGILDELEQLFALIESKNSELSRMVQELANVAAENIILTQLKEAAEALNVDYLAQLAAKNAQIENLTQQIQQQAGDIVQLQTDLFNAGQERNEIMLQIDILQARIAELEAEIFANEQRIAAIAEVIGAESVQSLEVTIERLLEELYALRFAAGGLEADNRGTSPVMIGMLVGMGALVVGLAAMFVLYRKKIR